MVVDNSANLTLTNRTLFLTKIFTNSIVILNNWHGTYSNKINVQYYFNLNQITCIKRQKRQVKFKLIIIFLKKKNKQTTFTIEN